ncbi:hypothetical protein [Hyphomonas sp.]|uniref:hypothetical protein n=1 Tax=Hyphomonas sp. TaxID=87 RepID=UPI0025B85A09|nr:hypothetical protein [Hyphomonas sp.]|tara:strand:+ start:1041 stop:2039 length:999 start_codon:yes stop_codon:yes gene_type:complete
MSFLDDLRRKATGILADDPSGLSSDAMPPMVNQQGIVPNPSYDRKESPFRNPNVDPFKRNTQNTNVPDSVMGINNDQAKRFFGMDLAGIQSQWKDKGGFEALMANPMFTLGLGLMKSSATGQPISQSLLNNAVTAGAISGEYADRIKERSKVLGPVTDQQRDEVRAVLAESDIFEGSVGQKFKNFFTGKNTEALNRRALDDIYAEAEKIAKKRAKPGKEVRIDRNIIEEAVKKMRKDGKIDISEKGIMSFFFGRGAQSTSGGLAKGGMAEAGKTYVVGEEGPEFFTPKATGKVVSNDDSNVVAMLLDANPQLKNVSLDRATKILKNRFPDYF